MSYAPPFLARFGLDSEADERAVKRAYARELRLIDQERDPAAFQELREARDAALHWLAAGHGQDDSGEEEGGEYVAGYVPESDRPASAPLEHPAEPDPRAPDAPGAETQAEDAGAAVFGAFAEHIARPLVSSSEMREMLDRSLENVRLERIDAKDRFEFLVARLLAGGWKPGHETLMEVATARFGWSADRRRLQRFGPAGQVLERYMLELYAFEQEDEPGRGRLRDTLRDLRLHAEPPGDGPDSMRRAEYLAARFPHLLGLLASGDNFGNWRKLDAVVRERQERIAARLQEHVDARASTAPSEAWTNGKAELILVAVIVGVLGLVGLVHLVGTNSPGLDTLPTIAVKQGASGPDAAGAAQSPSDAALNYLPSSAVDYPNCETAANYARERGVGTTYPRATLGSRFDHFVLMCVSGGYWVGKLENDPVVRLALERLKEKEHWQSHEVVAGTQARIKAQAAEEQERATLK